MQFLVGLSEAYKAIRGNILMMKPFPDIDEIYNLLLQEENQRGLNSTSQISPQAAAMHTQRFPPQALSQSVHSGQEPLGLAAQHRQAMNAGQKPQRRQYYCDHCKMHSHSIQRCYKIHGYPPGHKLYKPKGLAVSTIAECTSDQWHLPRASTYQSSSTPHLVPSSTVIQPSFSHQTPQFTV